MTANQLEPADLQRQIDMLRQQLAEAQRLSALGELVGTTTHEFNNVLMTILNYAKLGLRHKDDATRDKALQKILVAGERAAKITNTVLGMARNRSNSLEPTDLTRLVDESLVLLERELRKYRISVERQFDAIPLALVNGNQIQQVLLNLLTNARQAMKQGGRVIIKLGMDDSEPMVVLAVRDTGPGIPTDRLPRIFEPFYSTKEGPDETGKGGTGVGLSSCREIVEAHRGRIRVASSLGKGTEFTIKLPLAEQRAHPAPLVTAPTSVPTRT